MQYLRLEIDLNRKKTQQTANTHKNGKIYNKIQYLSLEIDLNGKN